MTRKKGKLMTFFWSLIPGAGEMYLGFFKQGISLMAAFFLLLGISGFLRVGYLTFLSPIVWFYSFFHTNNLNSLSDEEFYSLEDDYLFHWEDVIRNQRTLKKHKKLMSACLILFGLSILWNILSNLFFWYLLPALHVPEAVREFFNFLGRSIPQAVVAIAIIMAGVYLIKGKYEELRDEDSPIPGPPYLGDGNRGGTRDSGDSPD